MNDHRPKVVLLSLDGVNHPDVGAGVTPSLVGLRDDGGWSPAGGRCDVPAVTYVSHATLITGAFPPGHGVTSNLAARPQPGIVPGWAGEIRPRTPTLFSALAGAGIRAAAICGDQHLVPIIGAAAAVAWPPAGLLPAGTPVCPAGYATNAAVAPLLMDAVADPAIDFVFGHLNETDTWGHVYGPGHPAVSDALAATDAIVGQIRARLDQNWQQTVVIAVSDHGMEAVADTPPVDLLASGALRAVFADVVSDGGAALARIRSGIPAGAAGAALASEPAVVAWREIRPGVLALAGGPGVRFGQFPKAVRGVHGGPGTTRTVAIVAGGHPVVPRIAATLRDEPPHLADWAPTIMSVFGLPFSGAAGRDLTGLTPAASTLTGVLG